MRLYSTFLFVLLLLPIACVQAPKPVFDQAKKPQAPQGAITIMTYNLENLFDTEDDPFKNDEAYLPMSKKTEAVKAACRANNNLDWRKEECLSSDWNDSVLALKMSRLADVIKQVNNGRGPDVLIMEEVENRNVLEKWRREFLAELNYKPALLIEGPDERGIDVGILTRLEAIDPLNLHVLTFKENENLKASQISATRGILEATLKLPDGTLMTVLGVHLPSQGSPTETRRQALEQINKIKAGLPGDRLVVVGGDFNISSEEEYKSGLLAREMAKVWGVSHMLGCKDCKGTYYYKKDDSWSFFDVFLLSQNLLPQGQGAWKVLPETIRIGDESRYQFGRTEGPARFDRNRKSGVSDHWPLMFEIIKR